MNRYLTKLIFAVQIENSNTISEFDEQIRMIESWTAMEAFNKARNVGKREESVFKNTLNENVSWKFIDVSDVYAIEEVADGALLYSTTHKTRDPESYINYIRQKSIEIQLKSLIFA